MAGSWVASSVVQNRPPRWLVAAGVAGFSLVSGLNGFGVGPETTPASICVVLRRECWTYRKWRVAASLSCLYCSEAIFAFTLLRRPYWRCLNTQSAQRIWPARLGLAHWTQRPSDLRSARTCALCCWFFFLYASLRTLLGVVFASRVSWAAISFRVCSINSALIRGRGLMPFALRRFSEFCRVHSRCFSTQSGQRVCSCTAGWLQRHSPCSLRSCRVRAGFCLRVDGCGFGAWADFFWLGRVDFRLGPDFIRLRVRLGINMVSIKSCGFKVFIPTPSGRNWLPSCRPTPPEAIPGPRTCVSGQQHPVRAARRHTLAEASYFRWAWRACRCFSAQSGQRVWSGMAGRQQSLQRPCSLSSLRFSAARARARSCRSSGVRSTRFGFSDAFGFAAFTVAGFEALRGRAGAAFGLAGFLVLRLGAGLSS